jgi:hypothetical protein
MRMVLQAKDLWEVVSGEEERPAEERKAAAWEKKARKALATIALALSAAEKENIIKCTTPQEAWEVLEKLYEGKGRNRKFMLLQELFRMSNGRDDGCVSAWCQGENVGVGHGWIEAGR